MRKLISLLGAGLLLVAVNASAEEGESTSADAEGVAADVKEHTQAVAEKAGVRGTTTAKYGPAG